jgi:peptidylprolyl isomerase
MPGMRVPILAALIVAAAAASSVIAGSLPTPAEIMASAPASAWRDVAPDDLLVMTLAGDRRVVIQLAPVFSQAHVANIRTLARAHWWDGTAVYRVQDNYVAQWGDRTEKKPLPAGMGARLSEEYVSDRAPLQGRIVPMPSRDSYAAATGFLDGWPVAMDGGKAWLTHCYAMVGVARDLSPDAGSGAELYAVIGHAPRQLDRNIALVGRVIEGIDALASLPRGSDGMGVYGAAQTPAPILSVRLASELAETERPHFQMLDTGSPTFAAYAQARANRSDPFFRVPAGGVDICNVTVPVRRRP